MDDTTMRTVVAAARVARLATADASGRPHIVPFCFALDGDMVYSVVDDKPKRSGTLKRVANVRQNPRVSMLVDDYSDDWSQLWWIRLDGRATVVADEQSRIRAIQLLAEKYEQYRAQRPRGDVLEIAVERWSVWSGRR